MKKAYRNNKYNHNLIDRIQFVSYLPWILFHKDIEIRTDFWDWDEGLQPEVTTSHREILLLTHTPLITLDKGELQLSAHTNLTLLTLTTSLMRRTVENKPTF